MNNCAPTFALKCARSRDFGKRTLDKNYIWNACAHLTNLAYLSPRLETQ